MKLSSKVLAGSLASAGMVLSLVAPALTAQAATTTGHVNDDGTVVGVDKTTLNSLHDGNQLAIAYDGLKADGTTKADGVASGTSNASVNVISGVLVLDQVPDFNFGTAVSGQTKDLVDNTRGDGTTAPGATDGNSNGELTVLESRAPKSTDNADGATGFTLQAGLGEFVDSSNKASGATSAFELHLLPQDITNGKTTYANGTSGDLKTIDNTLEEKGDAAQIMNVDQATMGASYVQGQYTAKFVKADGTNPAGATLKIGDGIGDGKTATVKSLNAPITWTLSAKPNVTTQP